MPKGILVQYQKAGVIVAGVVLALSLTSCKSEEIVITPTPLPTVSQEVITPTEAPVVPTMPVEESPEPSPSDIIIIDGPDETPTPTKKPNVEKPVESNTPEVKPTQNPQPEESKDPVVAPEETQKPIPLEEASQEKAKALIKEIRANIATIQINKDSLSTTIKSLRETLDRANETMKYTEAILTEAQKESEKYKALSSKMEAYQQEISDLIAKLESMKADAIKLGNQINTGIDGNIELDSIIGDFTNRVNKAEQNIGAIHTFEDLKDLKILLGETKTWLELSEGMSSIDKTIQNVLEASLGIRYDATAVRENIQSANDTYKNSQSSSSSSSDGGSQTPPPPIEETTKDPNDNIDAGGFEKPATDGDSKGNPEDDGPRVQL